MAHDHGHPEKELQSLPAPDRFSTSDDDARDSEDEARALLDLEMLEDGLSKQTSKIEGSTAVPPVGDGLEYHVSTKTKLLLLGIYFTLNLSLTIYNKAILGVFAFPWILTSVHATCLAIGCSALHLNGFFTLTRLTTRESLVLVAFSVLFTANIAVSNISLALVSVPFHQTLRSTCPAFTVLLYRVFYSRTYGTLTYLSLLPIIAGAGLATYGDYYFTLVGFLLTLLGVVLAAVKTMATNRLMVGRLKLPPLELLLRLAPLAALQSLGCAFLAGEYGSLTVAYEQGSLKRGVLLAVLGNGVLAFLLNISSFKTNKAAGALTMAVAANTKQMLTILLGVVFFSVTVTPINGLGMAIALGGVAWYTKTELDSKTKS